MALSDSKSSGLSGRFPEIMARDPESGELIQRPMRLREKAGELAFAGLGKIFSGATSASGYLLIKGSNLAERVENTSPRLAHMIGSVSVAPLAAIVKGLEENDPHLER